MNTKVAKKNNKGFTLIELILVIAIIAVLATILAPQYLRYVEKSRVSSDEQYAEELRNAVKTSLADEAAAQAVGTTESSVTWNKTDGIKYGNDAIGAVNATISVANNESNAFVKELKTNLNGEKVSGPKSKKYASQTYTVKIKPDANTDSIGVTGAWGSQAQQQQN